MRSPPSGALFQMGDSQLCLGFVSMWACSNGGLTKTTSRYGVLVSDLETKPLSEPTPHVCLEKKPTSARLGVHTRGGVCRRARHRRFGIIVSERGSRPGPVPRVSSRSGW